MDSLERQLCGQWKLRVLLDPVREVRWEMCDDISDYLVPWFDPILVARGYVFQLVEMYASHSQSMVDMEMWGLGI